METFGEVGDYSCVYFIVNKTDNKFYIGSTVNFRKRRNGHLCKLRQDKHINKSLQDSFNKWGENNFFFKIAEKCNKNNLQEKEQFYLDIYFESGNLYNIYRDAYALRGKNHPMYNKHHTKEAREKIKVARSKQVIKHSKETREKISKSNLGKHKNPEHIQYMIDCRKGKAWNKGLTKEDTPSLKNKNEIIIDKVKMNDIISAYNDGYSINRLSKKHKYCWNVIKNNLLLNNIKIRNISEQKKITDKLKRSDKYE